MSEKGLAIIYDRASTRKQEENYTRQDVKRIGMETAKRFGYDTEDEPRFEVKSGEELKNRPVMLEILSDIRSGKLINGKKIAAIIVPNLTRLSRDEDIIDGLVIKKTCRDNGVVVIDFNGKLYDFERDNDQDTAFLEFWFAARDKRQIVSNTIRGSKERAMQGKYMGGFAPFGYKLVESGEITKTGKHLKKRVIDPKEARVVRKVFQLYKEYSAREAANMLNKKGTYLRIKNAKNVKKNGKAEYRPFLQVDVLRIIKNPLYAGWMSWGTGKWKPRSRYLRDFDPQTHFDPSLQIVSQEEYDRVQRIRAERLKATRRAAAGIHPFSYILKCLHCGGSMVACYDTNKFNKREKWLRSVYRCDVHFTNRENCMKGQVVSTYPVAHAVIELIKSLVKDKMRLAESLELAARQYSDDNNETVRQLEMETKAELEKTNLAMERVAKSIAEGIIGDVEARSTIQELRDKKERLTRDLRSFDENKNIKTEILEAVKYLRGNLDRTLWDMLQSQPKSFARVLRLLFKRHSVSVETFWDYDVKGRASTIGKRKGRVVEYQLDEEFAKTCDITCQETRAFQR